MPDELIENLYAETLEKHELQPSSFNLRKIKTAFLKSSPRPLVIVPAVSLAEIEGLPLSPSWRGIRGEVARRC
ncbi:MAG: hypothetical protein HY026_07215 [Deltaproteobacteria bacterium]|nr:hypothetical protein [Deltaproteobacteria bacterium]